MHHGRLKQRFYMHTDFTCICIVPMHGFMKNSDYSCTVSMHVQKIQKDSTFTFSLHLSSTFSTVHGKAQKTDLRAVQLYEKKEPKIPQDQTLKFSRKKSVKSSMKCTRRCGGQRPCIATPQRLSLGRWVSAAPRRVGGLRTSTTSVGWIRGISRAARSVSRHHRMGGNVAHDR